MKVAVCIYPISNWGGIINHTEDLAAGFRELGHKADLKVLFWQDKFGAMPCSKENKIKKKGWVKGELDLPVHQRYGWTLEPYLDKLCYKGEEMNTQAREILSGYDLVIWSIPVPTKQKAFAGNNDWVKLYDIPTKQVAIIHDSNLKRTPWIHKIKHHFTAIACVHNASYNSAQAISTPRAMILNPQDISKCDYKVNYKNRETSFISVQTFKRLKRVGDLVRAVPYLQKSHAVLAGSGIEQAYMTSPEKTRDEYFLLSSRDPDLPAELDGCGKRIWDYAIENGMEFLDFITSKQRDDIMKRMRVMVDQSWNIAHAKLGDVFNRTTIEAIIMGCLPVGRNLGIAAAQDGNGELFKKDENYIMIPHDATPIQFAETMDEACNLDEETYTKIIENNYKLLKHFDRKNIAKQFIELGNGKPTGFYGKLERGTDCPEALEKSEEICKTFFNIE